MATSCLQTRIGNRITDREMVHHLSLRGREVEIVVHLVVIERADAGRRESERLRREIEPMADSSSFEMHVAITAVPMRADGPLAREGLSRLSFWRASVGLTLRY